MCRLAGAGVGIGIVPESAARRNLDSLGLVQVELTDEWRVRQRYILVREDEAPAPYAQALIEAICAHYRGGVNPAGCPLPG